MSCFSCPKRFFGNSYCTSFYRNSSVAVAVIFESRIGRLPLNRSQFGSLSHSRGWMLGSEGSANEWKKLVGLFQYFDSST